MARKLKEVTIGGTEYRLTQLGGETGAELWLDLLHVIAGPLETLARSARTASEGDADDAGYAIIAAAVKALDYATVRKMIAAFRPLTRIRISDDRGERWPVLEGAVYDDHFAGNYLELSEWIVQSVVFNFLPFVVDGSLGSVVERLVAMMPSSTPTTT